MKELGESFPVIKSDIESLEGLVLDNDLDRLEALTAGFNIFESIGAVRREVRHSDFLSFLLNPNESHGIYDTFLKSILFSIVKRNRSVTNVSAIEIDLLDLSDVEVRREWEHIDILVLSVRERFVCAVENKIDSTEHSNQLHRYESLIKREFPEYIQLFVYLTVEGIVPERDQKWLPYSYADIYEVTKTILTESSDRLGDDIRAPLNHYAEMINRHLMEDNEIAELSRKIYQKHKKALDIIFEHKPDLLTDTNKCLLECVQNFSDFELVLDHSTKSSIRFSVKRWDQVKGQLSGEGQWTKTNRVVLFDICNLPTEISVRLYIGPGQKEFRENLFAVTEKEPKIFKARSKSLGGKWTQIYRRKIITKAQMEYDLESIENLIRQELGNFFNFGEFKNLCNTIDRHFGITEI